MVMSIGEKAPQNPSAWIGFDGGSQPKVCGEKREHVRIVNFLPDGHPVEQNPLVMSPDLLGDAPAGFVPNRNDDLGADQFHPFEGEARGEFGGSSGGSAAPVGCAHPVAEVAEFVNGMDMTQAAAAKQFPAFGVGNGKGIYASARPFGAGDGDVVAGNVLRITGCCPRHPWAKFGERFLNRFMQFVLLAEFKRAQGYFSIGEFGEWEHAWLNENGDTFSPDVRVSPYLDV